ncbi:bifunctional UDP-sugar hydrolase/5'-nucleotidase UshA [Rhodoferax saidenbachensis]|uniref:5'-nucleotidase/UDP-sugar diphosphatase n=1 Tax=Rhodoferax saidenbachensis TaxID=1484693 RepID=A0ABU1ZT16_9BURK|nr:bifunctional UDP-sugar hydrolase/5'-nucleotidase UshA [Rhodoferax saidenbachensis]MDR7308702.1 5'-nucleotidase/UDP-sugar diphosphatase [Rhodoferax saidenbachensis]
MISFRSTPTLLIALALAGCAPLGGVTPAKDTTYAITILHTNDHHGRFWKNNDGEYGLSAQKTVVDQVRAEVAAKGGHVLLLSGGDINTGVPESDLQDAVPDFRGMNLLRFDAMAVGNHEFDKPRAVLKMQRDLATFPMLSANIYDNGQRMFTPYKIFNLGGVRVGVMGLTTEDTYKMVHPDNVKGVEFRSVIAEANQVVPELRAKADVVIAATHMGHYVNGQHGTQAEGDVEMARAVKGIDLVVGGHSQNPVCMKAENVRDEAYVPGTPCAPDRQNGTWIVQAHEWGKYVGRADFEYRNGEFKLVRYALIPINLKKTVKDAEGKSTKAFYTSEIAEDPTMLQLLTPYQNVGQEKLGVAVGSSDARIEGDRSIIRAQPAAMGVLVGLSMMDRTRADFAVVNAGGVRDSLPAGTLTYKDVLKVQPFGNTIATVDFTGTEVLAYLNAVAKMSAGAGAFPQFAGVELVINGGVVSSARIRGAAVDATKTYRLVVNNFQAVGGDGYPKLITHPTYVDTGFVDAEVLRAYIAANSPLQAQRFAPGNSVVRQ